MIEYLIGLVSNRAAVKWSSGVLHKNRTALGLATVGLGVVLSACGSAQASSVSAVACGGSGAKLSVTGSGVATGTPDLLTMQLSVDVTAPTAQGALADNSTKTQAAIDVIKGTGVLASAIQTTGLSIQPHYDTIKNVTTQTGYEVVDSIVVRLSDLAKAGNTIDAVASDSLRVNSLSFSINNPQPVQDRARATAVRQAMSDAKSMAAAAGKGLGPVCSLTENTQSSYTPFNNANFGTAASAYLQPPVPLMPGTLSETVKVSAVYGLIN